MIKLTYRRIDRSKLSDSQRQELGAALHAIMTENGMMKLRVEANTETKTMKIGTEDSQGKPLPQDVVENIFQDLVAIMTEYKLDGAMMIIPPSIH